MKRKIKVYTAIETGNIDLIDIIELDIKKDGTIRNIDKLKFHEDIKYMLNIEKDEEEKGAIVSLVNNALRILKDGDISIFKNFRYNIHPQDKDLNEFNKYQTNNLLIYFESGRAKDMYLDFCINEMKDILFNPDIFDCFKLYRIDYMVFLYERIKDLNLENRNNAINNMQFTNAVKEEFPDLTEGEYLLIKKRLFVLMDIFNLHDKEQDSPYKEEIEKCLINSDDSIIEKYIKLNSFNSLIRTR